MQGRALPSFLSVPGSMASVLSPAENEYGMSDQLRIPLRVAARDCNTLRTKAVGLFPAKASSPGGDALLEEQSGRFDPALAGVAEPLLPLAMLHHGLPRPKQGAFGTRFPMLAVEVEIDRLADRQLVQMIFFVLALREESDWSKYRQRRGRRRRLCGCGRSLSDSATVRLLDQAFDVARHCMKRALLREQRRLGKRVEAQPPQRCQAQSRAGSLDQCEGSNLDSTLPSDGGKRAMRNATQRDFFWGAERSNQTTGQ